MYFAAVIAPAGIDQKVLRFKQYMHEKYGCSVGLKSPAHITLIPPFWFEGDKEDMLKAMLEEIALHIKAFKLETNDFSAFKPRTIFIALKKSDELSQLKQVTDQVISRYPDTGCEPEKRPFHPHITIATRDLYKKDFYEALPYFDNKEFREEWLADGISLLKHNKKNWDVVHTSRFRII